MKFAKVSRIDVSPLFGNDISKKIEVAKLIDQASKESGFFLAENHGLDVQGLAEVTTQFHQKITPEEKWNLAIEAYNPQNKKQKRNGYYMPIEGKKAVQSFCILNPSFTADHPHIQAGTPMHEVNVWPDENKYTGFRNFQENYFREVLDFSKVLLRGYALALGKDEDFFEPYVSQKGSLSAVSLIRYPFLENYPPVKEAKDGTKLSFESHYDVSMITVLYQSKVQNLQVLTDEGYLDIPATDDCFLVNVGTYMAHITNNYYPSPLHRVKWVNEERLSLPFFLNLDHESVIEPFIPHSNDASKNEAITYGSYLQKGLSDLIVSNGQT
ncbi:2OG-Fe(II) oxygenase family protein [Pseudoalteromonas umbrosa]|uniref:2OG-Fe(II) oxygenase family protein n=1 Tax=Pseudoalteromonas umbrosa TaxID=3048489 RepID=UPI0024C2E901|nr:2OG-Fe(II) oxygenase family protein [Pseudoalteromonas sp. B95]MDK1288213.1 2OG-Fe(II) oxygenase family protein [Pseudoalteromonas sp. B95]